MELKRLFQRSSEATEERRRAPRLFADEQVLVQVTAEDPAQRPDVLPARVLDVSVQGLRVATQRPLPEAREVRVLTPGFDLSGSIVWTRKFASRYESGILTSGDEATKLIQR